MLDAALLVPAITDLASEGYNWVSLSGGEPVLYPPLPELLKHSQALGMQTTLVSNGMLLTARQLDRIQPHLDLLVISLDGKPESHNAMRGSERAFELMASRLAGLRQRGLAFGFIFTLTQHNLDELPWVAEFAASSGARLLQIHPLEDFGNATRRLRGKVPDGTEGAYAWVLGQQIQKRLEGRMTVQVDLLHSSVVERAPEVVYAADAEPAQEAGLAELISPLVIEADGTVVPLQYGFPRQLALGSLAEASLPTLAKRWRECRWPVFRSLCRALRDEILSAPEATFFNWYECVAAKAEAQFGKPVSLPRRREGGALDLAG
jgi:MoaA/NifB/PqqE/SkfB family radical SAM enzyme